MPYLFQFLSTLKWIYEDKWTGDGEKYDQPNFREASEDCCLHLFFLWFSWLPVTNFEAYFYLSCVILISQFLLAPKMLPQIWANRRWRKVGSTKMQRSEGLLLASILIISLVFNSSFWGIFQSNICHRWFSYLFVEWIAHHVGCLGLEWSLAV